MTTTISKDALVAAVVALAEAGIPTDTQELLLQGDPMRGIKPGALQSAIMSALSTPHQPEAQGDKGAEAFAQIVAARKAFVDATAAYNARLAVVKAERDRGNWSIRVDPEYHAMSDAQSAFHRTVQDLADAALSTAPEAKP